jgi:hypothetical protein
VEIQAPLVGRTTLAASTVADHYQRVVAGEYERLWRRGGDASSSGWKGGANGQTGALREMRLFGYHRDEAVEMLPVVVEGRLHNAHTDCHH